LIPLVIDTGVLVAGLYWLNESHQCLRAWQQGLFRLVVSDAVFDEYRRVAWRVKERERLPGDPGPLLRLISERALWVAPEPLARAVCRDPKDDKFIEAALAGRARWLIARDPDLTDLEKPFGVEIVTPRQFLGRLPRQVRRQLEWSSPSPWPRRHS
jgi:putative PIN family toxin of toxin-antitoxin system